MSGRTFAASYCKLRTQFYLPGLLQFLTRTAQSVKATRYGLDGLGIESRWERDFPHMSRRPWGPTNLLYNEYGGFLGRGEGKVAGAWG